MLDRVATTLVLLTTGPPNGLSDQAMVIPVVIIIGREITMSALREWAASASAAAHTVIVPLLWELLYKRQSSNQYSILQKTKL